MIEVDFDYGNGQRETLKFEDGEWVIMPRAGRIVAVRDNGVPCQIEVEKN